MKIVLILLSLFLVNCGGKIKSDNTIEDYKIVKIDGCEYIAIESSTHSGFIVTCLTHKGDCKNSFHK